MRSFILVQAVLILSFNMNAKADPRPPGGHNIPNVAIPKGTCKRVLFYYNKFSSAYRNVCNNGDFFISDKLQ